MKKYLLFLIPFYCLKAFSGDYTSAEVQGVKFTISEFSLTNLGRINIVIFSKTNRIALLLDTKFSPHLELRDAMGNLVKKTKIGNRMGSKYFDVWRFSFDVVQRTPNQEFVHFIWDSPVKIHPIKLGEAAGSSEHLADIFDVFEISSSGKYELKVFFQCFVASTKKSTNFNLVKFPPVIININLNKKPVHRILRH